ncbi:helix-turn-helix transcriptional regulator [Dysgonomonas capnocytophagoides]|uniref:helix-turn-helix domain-containing protein n=1 Tax=Dysgonomonas capnocytophagoides TaxID=45254 RepID=UPI002A80A39B|nr:helix-turn-helix transcriptional regulator [Dysgonomonas capnocytophagoides]
MNNRIRDLREDMDLRQIDVANATGIDQKTLSNYETGKTCPDSVALIKLADFFKVSIDYLVGRIDSNLMYKRDVVSEITEIQKKLEQIKTRL